MLSYNLLYTAIVLVVTTAWTTGQPRDEVDPVDPIIPFRPCPRLEYDALYDLQNNLTQSSPFVTVLEGLVGEGCRKRGVLKIELPEFSIDFGRRRALIDLYFDNPTGFVFSIANSRNSIDPQIWDTKVQGIDTTLIGKQNFIGNSVEVFKVPNLYNYRLTLIIDGGTVVWFPDDNNKFNFHSSSIFLGRNGQQGRYLYLGINRGISTPDIRGWGVCKVGIKFLKQY